MAWSLPTALAVAIGIAVATDIGLTARHLVRSRPAGHGEPPEAMARSRRRALRSAAMRTAAAAAALLAAVSGIAATATDAAGVVVLAAAVLVRMVLRLPASAPHIRRQAPAALAAAAAVGLLLPHAGAAWWVLCWAAWLAVAVWHERAGSGRDLRPLPPEQAAGLSAVAAAVGAGDATLAIRPGAADWNARAEGIGRRRRIVLNEGLITGMAPAEVAAVAAHEAGHLAGRHRGLFLAWRAALCLAALVIAHGLHGDRAPVESAVLLVLAATPLALLVAPAETALIRRWEFDADRRAAAVIGADALAAALARLFAANAAVMRPEPVYAAFHSPHPAPAERLARLRGGRP